MGYLGLGFMRIELEAPVTISAQGVDIQTVSAVFNRVALLAIIQHPGPIPAFPGVSRNRAMEPSVAVRLFQRRIRLPRKV